MDNTNNEITTSNNKEKNVEEKNLLQKSPSISEVVSKDNNNLDLIITTTTTATTATTTTATTSNTLQLPHQTAKSSNADIMSASITELTNTVETEKAVEMEVNNECDPQIFVSCLEKLLNAIKTVDKHLDNVQKQHKEFYEFEKQNLKLNSIKDALESLATALKTSLTHKKAITEKSNKETSKKISKLLSQLTKDHQAVVKKYKDKNGIYIKSCDTWKEFHDDYAKINDWLNSTLIKIEDLKVILEPSRTEDMIRDFSNLTNYRLQLERTNLNGHEIAAKSNDADAKKINEKLNNLNRSWKNLVSSLNELKEMHTNKANERAKAQKEQQNQQNAEREKTAFEQFNLALNEANVWVLNGHNLLSKEVSPVDELENERLIFDLREYEKDLPYRQSNFESFYEKVKSKFTPAESELATLHFKQTVEKIAKLNELLSNKRITLENNVEQLRGFQEELNAMNNWITNLNLDLLKQSSISASTSSSPSPPPTSSTVIKSSSQQNIDKSKSSTPSPSSSSQNLFDANSIRVALNTKSNHLKDLKSIYDSLNKRSKNKMPENIKTKMDNLLSQWETIEKTAAPGIASSSEQALQQQQQQQLSEAALVRRASSTKKVNAPLAPVNIQLQQPVVQTTYSQQQNVTQASPTKTIITTTTTITTASINESDLKHSPETEIKHETKEAEQQTEIITKKPVVEEAVQVEVDKPETKNQTTETSSEIVSLQIVEQQQQQQPIQQQQIQQQQRKSSAPSSEIEALSNDLFEWLLWIDHTLQSHVVTVGDLEEIQQAIHKYNSILNEVYKKESQLDKLIKMINQQQLQISESDSLSSLSDSTSQIHNKLKQLNIQWKESTKKVNERKQTLETMLNECRKLEQINFEFTNRIVEMEAKLKELPNLGSGRETLTRQRAEYKEIKSEINQLKQLFDELKEINQTIIDKYQTDDITKIKVQYERLVGRFNELSFSLLNRGNNITEALQIIEDYDGTLFTFTQWLTKIEKDVDYVEDYCVKHNENDDSTRQTVFDLYKELQKEIDNHNSIYSNLTNSANKIIDSHKNKFDKDNLQKRIEDINRRWNILRKKALEIRSRLESNSAQWSALINSLNELIGWCDSQQNQIDLRKQNLQLDYNYLQKQTNDFKVFMCNIEYKKSIIESTINSAKLYFDDKKQLQRQTFDDDLVDGNFDENDANDMELIKILDESKKADYIVKKINRKLKLLEHSWTSLNRKAIEYNETLLNFNDNLLQLVKLFDIINQKLNENEQLLTKISQQQSKELIDNEKLIEELDHIKSIKLRVASYQSFIDEMNVKYANLKQELNAQTQPQQPQNTLIDTKFNDLNKRWIHLTSQLQDRYLHLYNLVENSGANIFLKLNESVQSPWQRGISPLNKLPYYINHQTQTTTWEHPKMTELYKSFNNLNDIRFSAYRTSMKLRTLQKRLWLDLVNINDAIEAFEKHGFKTNNERNMDVNQIIQCLNTLFQPACKQHSQIINLVHAVDLTLNWLLSVYDPSRCGQIRVLSMKVAIVLLCKGSIEDKYKYIFSLIAGDDDLVTQRKLGLLLYEMIMIPKQLGEVAAFGGSNIEPSVRSCFEYAKNSSAINLRNFLDWLKLEPQSIVWLPVLHRLAAAETAKHEAKCSICKEYPIVGFRYRSLKHFNFDICQNCFFSGRKIKGFKFDHPLLEYYTPTSSSDDIKDFFRIFRNKFRSKRSRRSSKLGYLPVQTVLEGDDFESPLTQSPLQSPLHNQQKPQYDSYPTRIINEEKLNQVNLSTSQLFNDSDEEHVLIAQYCQSLSGETNIQLRNITASSSFSPKNQLQFINDLNVEQQIELETIIHDLEDENRMLMEEYHRLQAQLNNTSLFNRSASTQIPQSQQQSVILQQTSANGSGGGSLSTLNQQTTTTLNSLYRTGSFNQRDNQIIEEAKLLRQHEGRLEARIKILENHNRLLATQLKQLRFILNNPKEHASKYSTMTGSTISSMNETRKSTERTGVSGNIGALFHNVEDITRAINNLNNLVNVMNSTTATTK